MRISLMIAMLLSGVLMVILGGCYGNSPVLNPVVTIDLPKESAEGESYVPLIEAGGGLTIKGSVKAAIEDDVIESQLWTQRTSRADGMLGYFYVTDTLQTSWQAPFWTGPGELPITLTFTVDTAMGGHTTKSLNVLVLPLPVPGP